MISSKRKVPNKDMYSYCQEETSVIQSTNKVEPLPNNNGALVITQAATLKLCDKLAAII